MKRKNLNGTQSYRIHPHKTLENVKALIVCNGLLSKRLINKFTKFNKSRRQFIIIAADGASNFLYKHKIIPDYIVGDLDSITPAAKKYFSSKKVTIKKVYDQNKNDVEKCILFAMKKGYRNLLVTGLSGKRLDHTINNLSLLKKYTEKADIKCYDNDFEYYFMRKETVFNYKIGEAVSLLALTKTSGITTKGLKYTLKNGTLEFGGKQGALNIASSKSIQIEMKEGNLFLLRKHFGKIPY